VGAERFYRAAGPHCGGALVTIASALGAFVNLWFLVLSGFVGMGLVFAGVTDSWNGHAPHQDAMEPSIRARDMRSFAV
jgi:UPF0716 family protein affecting phage T7 exclusion